jgi:hypothetical protein
MTFDDEVARFLREGVLTRREVDRFLDPDYPKWATFDPTFGHVPHPCVVPDGADGSLSVYSYDHDGARRVVNGRGEPCRIATYGDSFTQGVQVSDGQTWQEVLAAHLGEPIRNFGVGGYGVYQAVRRLEDRERGETRHPYVVLNVYWPDHHRSVDAYRLVRLGDAWRQHDLASSTSMFHGNPWEHVRLDASGEGIELRPNVCPTSDDLYQLCDADFVVEAFRDDLIVHIVVATRTDPGPFIDRYRDLAASLGLDPWPDPAAHGDLAPRALFDAYAQRVSLMLLRRLAEDLGDVGSSLLVLLSYPSEVISAAAGGVERPDLHFVDGLRELGIPYFDSMIAHLRDFDAFSLSPDDYVVRYYDGHYTPTGNQFFAHSVRDIFREWLDPAPPTYRATAAADAATTDVTASR